jgi:hypothetical protein
MLEPQRDGRDITFGIRENSNRVVRLKLTLEKDLRGEIGTTISGRVVPIDASSTPALEVVLTRRE